MYDHACHRLDSSHHILISVLQFDAVADWGPITEKSAHILDAEGLDRCVESKS